MIMRSNVEFAASAIVMLLVTIGPLETAAIFGVLTSGARRSARRRLAIEAVAIAGGVLLVFAIGGTDFLRLLHVRMPAFPGFCRHSASVAIDRADLRSAERPFRTDGERGKRGQGHR